MAVVARCESVVRPVCAKNSRMRAILGEADRLARSRLPVLITGESGVGKELVATLLHDGSGRGGSLVPVNCGALPPSLAESELFGHVRGAFTGAATDVRGAFERADRGTLFLDEIGELPLDLQPKLLRVLETLRVRPVGGGKERAIDVRIIAATHRNLSAMTANGTFRKDLLYRLDVLSIEVPPLRDRPEDLAVLVPALLQRHGYVGRVEEEALTTLQSHDWPGNVRELRNVLMRATRRANGSLTQSHVIDALRRPARRASGRPPELMGGTLRQSTFATASRLLRRNYGDVAATYKEMGVPRSTFYRWLKKGWVARPTPTE